MCSLNPAASVANVHSARIVAALSRAEGGQDRLLEVVVFSAEARALEEADAERLSSKDTEGKPLIVAAQAEGGEWIGDHRARLPIEDIRADLKA